MKEFVALRAAVMMFASRSKCRIAIDVVFLGRARPSGCCCFDNCDAYDMVADAFIFDFTTYDGAFPSSLLFGNYRNESIETLVIALKKKSDRWVASSFLLNQLPVIGIIWPYVTSLTKIASAAGQTSVNRGFGPSMFAAPAVSSLKSPFWASRSDFEIIWPHEGATLGPGVFCRRDFSSIWAISPRPTQSLGRWLKRTVRHHWP